MSNLVQDASAIHVEQHSTPQESRRVVALQWATVQAQNQNAPTEQLLSAAAAIERYLQTGHTTPNTPAESEPTA